MRAILDTNVFLSAVFFGGLPGRILQTWRDGRLELVLSLAIFEEYRRAGERLAERFGGTDFRPLLFLLASSSEFFDPPPLPRQVCSDADDDKFIACALAAKCLLIISGDKALLRESGYGGISIMRPRDFLLRHLGAES